MGDAGLAGGGQAVAAGPPDRVAAAVVFVVGGDVADAGVQPTREQQLQAEVEDLTTALGEAAVELRVWKKSAEHRLGPSTTSR